MTNLEKLKAAIVGKIGRDESLCKGGHSSIGGSMMTSWWCQMCGKDQEMWGSTNTPRYCDDCAKQSNRCRRCTKTKKQKFTLADVLLAMDCTIVAPFFDSVVDWELFLFNKWDLTKDLDGQSPEVWQLLLNILNKS